MLLLIRPFFLQTRNPKMKIKSLFIKSILVLTSVFMVSAYADDKSCSYPDTIFYCTTKNFKEVTVCDKGNQVTYQFGKIGQKEEIFLTKNKKDVIAEISQGRGYNISAVNVSNGKVTYTLSSGQRDDGSEFSDITVIQGSKILATIKCDINSTINKAGEHNLPEAN